MGLGIFVEGYSSFRDRRLINLFDHVVDDGLNDITAIIDRPNYYILSRVTHDFREFKLVELSPLDEKIVKLPLSLQFSMFPKLGLNIRPRAIITRNGRIYVDPDILTDAYTKTKWYMDLLLENLRKYAKDGKIAIEMR